MVSANPTGPLTVAPARNGAYGDSVARLLAFAGHDVAREYYYNDAGAQMERFRASVEAVGAARSRRRTATTATTSRSSRAVPGDPVAAMLHRIEASLERFRVHFDSWARQSDVEQRLPELLPRLDTYEKDGAIWARSSAYGDEEDRVLIRSDGGAPTYRAADVAYLVDKLERGFDRAIYVLGADHHGTRNWYAAIARMLGYDPNRVEVLLYQLVHLTSRAASRRRCRSAAATSSSSTSSWTRSASTPPAGTSSSAGPTRRSRSTSISRPRSRRRTRSTTCSTRTRGSPGSSGTRATRPCLGRAAGRARAGGARARQAARRVPRGRRRRDREARPAGDPAVRDPRRRRLPPLLPRAPRARERASSRSGSRSAARRRR